MPDDTTPPESAGTAAETPAQENPWGDNFDAAKAWQLIQNLRGDKEKLQSRIAGYEKAEQEKADALEKLAERAERAEAALAERDKATARANALDAVREKHGLSKDDLLFLDGVPEEELDARASALAKRLAPQEDPVPARPRAALTPGHSSAGDPPAEDPREIAQAILAAR